MRFQAHDSGSSRSGQREDYLQVICGQAVHVFGTDGIPEEETLLGFLKANRFFEGLRLQAESPAGAG